MTVADLHLLDKALARTEHDAAVIPLMRATVARLRDALAELDSLRAQANCGEGHDPERICCFHAAEVKRLRKQQRDGAP